MGPAHKREPASRCRRDLQLRVLALCLECPRTLAELRSELPAGTRDIVSVLEEAVAQGVIGVGRGAGGAGRYGLASEDIRTMVATLEALDRTSRPRHRPSSPGDGWAA